VEEIEKFPYFVQRKVEDAVWKNSRGDPLHDKVDFNSNILPTSIFSNPAVIEGEKIKRKSY